MARRNSSDSWENSEEHAELPLSSATVKQQFTNRFAIAEDNPGRFIWNIIVALLLTYVGTVFPYVLSFHHFRYPPAPPLPPTWAAFEIVVDILFYVDLFVYFFFTYRDAEDREVFNVTMISRRYLQGFFFLNAFACIPPESVNWLISTFEQERSGRSAGANEAVRVMRIPSRVSRLTRLVRLTRLAKVFSFIKDNPMWQSLQSIRGVRIFNFAVGLFIVVHILACGWYLCAVLHGGKDDIAQTWLGRRVIAKGGLLMDAPPAEQWLHSIYFIFTVFTTVGFGDISAFSTGEIIYVCCVMLIGAIVHSVIVSSMINVVTSVDQQELNITEQSQLVEQFSNHMELPKDLKDSLVKWIGSAGSMARYKYDRSKVKKLLTSSAPRDLVGRFPTKVFRGRLWSNDLIQVALRLGRNVPPRFPIFVALEINKQNYDSGEVVYYAKDYPFNVFLVTSGVFACVAQASPDGGVCAALTEETRERVQLLKKSRRVTEPESVGEAGADDWMLMGYTPFQLIGRDKYFGESDILENCVRRRTMVCQRSGVLFMLQRNALLVLMEEFPVIAERWRVNARLKERRTDAMMKGHTIGTNFKTLAAIQIQRVVRERICHTCYEQVEQAQSERATSNPLSSSSSLHGKISEHVGGTVIAVTNTLKSMGKNIERKSTFDRKMSSEWALTRKTSSDKIPGVTRKGSKDLVPDQPHCNFKDAGTQTFVTM